MQEVKGPTCLGHYWAVGILLGLLLADSKATYNSNFKCLIGLDSPGGTIPKGDIVLEYGNPLEIFCNLDLTHKDAQGYNSSDLVFYRDTKPVNPEFITIQNETTIRLYEERPPASNAYYYCRLRTQTRDMGVCLNAVAIGYKPQEVINFTCLSHNWSNLTCRWTKPENYIKTKYSLHFHLPGRAGGRMTFSCPDSVEENNLRKNLNKNEDLCFWDHTTSPPYRQPYEYYYFIMTGKNQFGSVSFSPTKFHHYSHVIPSSAEKLVPVSTTTNSIEIGWEVPFPMNNFPPGVVHKVEYQDSWDARDTWHIVNTSELGLHGTSRIFNITGLRYANTLYDIRVYMRSSLALGEDKWSQPATLTVKTDPTIPATSPLTDIGSFEVTEGITRDVYVYWQYIPEYLQNGEGFSYKIFVKENNIERPHMTPSEMTKAYAKFKNLSHNSYTFTVVAANEHGQANTKSVVYVPSRKEIPPEPVSFTKIAFGHDLYELSWKQPVTRAHVIESYTIFWCENERDRPYQCTGLLNWTHVPNNVFEKNITVPHDKIHQFAISANTKNTSSGMIWASCTVLHNNVPGKMKSVWISRIGSTFIEVDWRLECSDRIGIVKGFRVFFCPIVAPNNLTCKEPQQSKVLDVSPVRAPGNVTGLRPYTTYMLTVAIITNNGEGLQSDPLFNTTLEAAPDPPRNINASSITNTSVTVEWIAPECSNGHIRFYRVHYNDLSVTVENSSTMNTLKMNVKLENLTSYFVYQISVEACTTDCSRSSPIFVTTEIGRPSKMEHPDVRLFNSSLVLISWKPPAIRGGHINFYQVMVQQTDEVKNTTTFYFTSVGNESQIPIPDCEAEGYRQKYTFMVRAVNIDKSNYTHRGVWSDPGETSCYNPGNSKVLVTFIWVVGVLVILGMSLGLTFAGRRIYKRCKEMQDLEVKLPPGLDPALGKDKDQDFQLDVTSWPSNMHDHLSGRTRSSTSADEELLLQKKEERHGRNPSGASSGCSSGHESVSSSLTSGTQISTDSGTEVDQHPPSPDVVFEESPWIQVSLRQRNVSALRQAGDQYIKMNKGSDSIARSTPNLTDSESLASLGVGGTYSCLGASTGYVSMPSSEEIGTRNSREGSGYCKVGLEPLPTQRACPLQQQQQLPTSPGKGYVVLPASIDTPSTGSSSLVHQPVSVPQPQLHGYVAHTASWSPTVQSPKESPTSKGYVIAGELGSLSPIKSISTPPLLIDVEDETDDVIDLEPLSEPLSHESYSRFALRPLHLGERTISEPTISKQGSGFRTPTSGSQDTDAEESPAHQAVAATIGYVPHKQFEKRDNEHPVSSHSDDSYSLVSLSPSDTNMQSSPV